MNPDHYELEFFEDDNGVEHCRKFLEDLPPGKRLALEEALANILAREGIDVCKNEFGKQLGDGLAEFRLRHNELEVVRRYNPGLADQLHRKGMLHEDPDVLLRVFFHCYGNKLVLLLAGYDKGKDPSKRRQSKEIKQARRLLGQFRSRRTDSGAGQRSERGVPKGRSFLAYYRKRRPRRGATVPPDSR